MPHTLILGITGTGKTTLARQLARRYRLKGIPAIVLDPFLSKQWEADFITDKPEKFIAVLKKSRSCSVFVDECGLWCETNEPEMKWLATNSRHFGHNCHFITQRAAQISPTIRTQCENIFLFRQSFQDTKNLIQEFVAEDLAAAQTLNKGEYLSKLGVNGSVKRFNAFFS